MKFVFWVIVLTTAFLSGCTAATPISKNMPKATIVNNHYYDSVIGLTFKMPQDWHIIDANQNNKQIAKFTNNQYTRALMENKDGNSLIEVSVVKTNIAFVFKNLQPTIDLHENKFRELFKNNPEDTYEVYPFKGCGIPCYFLKANVKNNEPGLKRKLELRKFMTEDPISGFINLIEISFLSDQSNYEKYYSSYIEALNSMEIN